MNFLEENFQCHGCGRCCRGWKVSVDAHSFQRVQGSDLEASILRESGAPGMVRDAQGGLMTSKKNQDECIYLDSANRCRIHADIGARDKPLGCQQFPFILTQCPDGLAVSVSFYCPSVQQGRGPELSTYGQELSDLQRACSGIPTIGRKVPIVAEGPSLAWEDYLEIESPLRDSLTPELFHSDFIPRLGQAQWALARFLEGQGQWRDRVRLSDSPAARDGHLLYLRHCYLVGFLDRVEQLNGRLLTLASENLPLEFPSLGLTCTWEQLENIRGTTPLAWWLPQLTRYLRAVLWRRFLALAPGLLENLLVLALLPTVIETYTCASALARQAKAPELCDFFVGVERCERDLITHAREAYAMSGSYLRFFRQRVSVLLKS